MEYRTLNYWMSLNSTTRHLPIGRVDFRRAAPNAASSTDSRDSRVKCHPHWLLDRTTPLLISVSPQRDLSAKVEIICKMIICALRFQTKQISNRPGCGYPLIHGDLASVIPNGQCLLPLRGTVLRASLRRRNPSLNVENCREPS